MTGLRGIAVLIALAAGSGCALAWFAARTEKIARANRQAAETRILRELAGAEVDVRATGDILVCEPDLVVAQGRGRGYGGELRLAVAFDHEGAVRAVRVIEHRETPGFGDILKPGAPWIESFGRRRDVHAVTGATVTSTAVMAAVARVARRGGECLP